MLGTKRRNEINSYIFKDAYNVYVTEKACRHFDLICIGIKCQSPPANRSMISPADKVEKQLNRFRQIAHF